MHKYACRRGGGTNIRTGVNKLRTVQARIIHEALKAGHANEAAPDVLMPVALAAQAALAVVDVHAWPATIQYID